MSGINSTTGPGFDPFNQTLTFLGADGITPINVTMGDIEAWRKFILTNAIATSAQIGAALVMIVVVLMLNSFENLRKPMSILNIASLVLSALSNILLMTYYPSSWTTFYVWFSGDNSFVSRSAFATSIAADIFGPIYLTALELSLLYQTKVMWCKLSTDRHRWAILSIGFFVAMVAVSFNVAQSTMNIIATYDTAFFNNPAWSWIVRAVDITYTVSIWFFCLSFGLKLALALYSRHRMGLTQFRPYQIVGIMAGCTMVLPSIFSCLEFDSAKLGWEPGPVGHTLVALMLPLSTLWAGASMEGRFESDINPTARRRAFFGSLGSSIANRFALRNRYNNSAAQNVSSEESAPEPYRRPTARDFVYPVTEPLEVEGSETFESHVSTDIEAGTDSSSLDKNHHVVVERSFSVRSSRGFGDLARN